VQEVHDIVDSDCVLHQLHMQVTLLNKSINVQNGVIPTRKYEYGMACSRIRFFQTCPAILQMKQIDGQTWLTLRFH
jgi:hypothetical protein